MRYRGDLDAKKAAQALAADPSALLVDVRSAAEWSFVGVPVMAMPEQKPVFVEWQRFPGMEISPTFVDQVRKAVSDRGGNEETEIYFICRSGVRSAAAAAAMTEAGFQSCFNVSDGFEGPADEAGHRGTVSGWKAAGLPWSQS